jgi:hypothetical protein
MVDYDEMRSRLFALIQSVSTSMSHRYRELVLDFVENNEFGVAIHWINMVLKSKLLQLDEEVRSEMVSIAEATRTDLDAP